jgi:hypothetical protein
MLWQYIATFIISLAVALIAVWFAQWFSTKRDYRKILENIRSEINSNTEVSALIIVWIDSNIKALDKDELVAASCPHFYYDAWVFGKGSITISDYPLYSKLGKIYFKISMANELLRTVEELTWGIAGAMTGSESRRKTVFEVLQETVERQLLPQLIEANKLLDNMLKISSPDKKNPNTTL